MFISIMFCTTLWSRVVDHLSANETFLAFQTAFSFHLLQHPLERQCKKCKSPAADIDCQHQVDADEVSTKLVMARVWNRGLSVTIGCHIYGTRYLLVTETDVH